MTDDDPRPDLRLVADPPDWEGVTEQGRATVRQIRSMLKAIPSTEHLWRRSGMGRSAWPE